MSSPFQAQKNTYAVTLQIWKFSNCNRTRALGRQLRIRNETVNLQFYDCLNQIFWQLRRISTTNTAWISARLHDRMDMPFKHQTVLVQASKSN